MIIKLPAKGEPIPYTKLDPIQFVTDIEAGIIHDKRDAKPGYWRVSSLVGLWDPNYGGGKCDKMLALALNGGEESDFESDTVKRFHIGTKVHDIIKDYFDKSPHFKVIHEELPIRHPTIPLLGTMDMVVEWDKIPGKEFVVEFKSVESTYFNNPIWGSRIKPFKKARWQAGLYSEIYKAPPIVVYYCKDNSEIVAHFLKPEDYKADVDEILDACKRVYKAVKKESTPELALASLDGICRSKCKQSCPVRDKCDVGKSNV